MQPGMNVGPYRVLEQVGLGGMATVFKAYDPGTDRYVAIKIVSPQFAQHPEFRERFRREAKSIARLEHPHIIPVHAFGEEGDTAYLVLRYMDTGTLRDRMNDHPLAFHEAGKLIDQIAGALDYAHRNGVIHRDVKPSNVLLDAEGNAYLTDFGIAKIVEATVELTGTGTAMGTPQYMSPEQCRGDKNLTAATDIYSLGVMAYQMLTGRVPFEADTPLAVIFMHINDPLTPPRQLNPQISEELERVLLKALAKDPKDRYATAAEFAARLRAALPRPAPVEPTPPQVEKAPPTVAKAAAVAAQPAARAPSGWLRFWWVGALVIVLGAAAFFVVPQLSSLLSSEGAGERTEEANFTGTLSAGLPTAAAAIPTATTAEAAVVPDEIVWPTSQPGEINCMGSSPGDRIYLLHPWGEEREQQLRTVIEPLLEACDLVLTAEWMADPGRIGERLQGFNPPNVVIWDNFGRFRQNVDSMTPLDAYGGQAGNYPGYWIDLGSAEVGDPPSMEWLAAPLTVMMKSLIWYSPEQFNSFGYEVPERFAELEVLVERMAADGNVPWAMGLEADEVTGWAGSDFIQDLLVTLFGPEFAWDLINGRQYYDNFAMVEAYERYLRWARDPHYSVGGAQGTLNTNFFDAVLQPFSSPPQAMMVYQAGWAADHINAQIPNLVFGESLDFFPFPGLSDMQGSVEWLTLIEPSPAAAALIAYLTGAEGARNLASQGNGVSPNLHAADAHQDPYLAKQWILLEGAQGLIPDLGDTITGDFHLTEYRAIVDTLRGADVPSALQTVAATQTLSLDDP